MDIMENFIVGGETFEKYIGKSVLEEVEEINNNNIENMEEYRDKTINNLFEKYKDNLMQIQNNKTQAILNLINDAASICILPANKPLMKYLG